MTDPRSQLATILWGEAAATPPPGNRLGWERLTACARRNGVGGLLLHALERRDGAAPADVTAALRLERECVARANHAALRHLLRITGACRAESIDVMALKGAALLLRLYDDVGSRPMVDLDLLIRPEAAGRFERVARSLGYARGRQLVRDDFYPRYHYEAEYGGGGSSPVRLDVHVRPWRPMRYARLVPESAMWDATRSVPLAGGLVTVPGDDDMLAHLSCHAAFHGAHRLLWLADIAGFSRRYGASLDWDRLADRLAAWRLTHAARQGFEAAEAMCGAFLPSQFREKLSGYSAGWRDRLALWQAPRDAASPWTHTLVDLICMGGYRDRLGYFAAVAFPGAAHMGESYRGRHRGWLPAAYLARAFRKLTRLTSGPVATHE